MRGRTVTKLSPAQQHVVDRMREGWQLGFATGLSVRVWLQQNGLGQGGQTEDLRIDTLLALRKARIIVAGKWDFPTTRFFLSKEAQDV